MPERPMFYVLDPAIGNGKVPVPVPWSDTLAWGRFMERPNSRRVALTDIGLFVVSTVFLGIDHAFQSGPPILFETMVFHAERWHSSERVGSDLDCRRWTTWEDAEIGHRETVAEWEDKIE